MKTKALLLTVALGAAGAATSMAQVYSQNAVGYINLSLPAGFSMIADQLNPSNGDRSLASVLPTPPPGTGVYKFTGSGFSLSVFDDVDLVWTPNGSATIDAGKGVWINLPTAATITFVGDVPQGSLSTATPTGFTLAASQVPQSGLITTALGLNAGPGDSIYKYTGSGFNLFVFDDVDLVWTPSEPSMNVGEAFWLLRAPGSPSTWTRSFSVNP